MQSFSIPAEISHIRVSWAANCTCVSAWADGSYDSRSQIMLHVGVSFSVLSFFPAICVYPIHRMVGVTSLGPWKDPFLHREFRRVLFCQIVTKGTGMGNHVMSPRGAWLVTQATLLRITCGLCLPLYRSVCSDQNRQYNCCVLHKLNGTSAPIRGRPPFQGRTLCQGMASSRVNTDLLCQYRSLRIVRKCEVFYVFIPKQISVLL